MRKWRSVIRSSIVQEFAAQPAPVGHSSHSAPAVGTTIQPAVDLLDRSDDFPKTGPIRVIADGYCDRHRIHRPHAYLTPGGWGLPFVPNRKVFRMTGPRPLAGQACSTQGKRLKEIRLYVVNEEV